MENKLTLRLGGEERTLIMDNMGFMRNLGEVNKDGFDLLNTDYFLDPGKAYKAALIIVHAGLLSAGYKDLTKEQVQEWLDAVSLEMVEHIHYAGIAALSRKSVEELKNAITQATQQNGSTKVNG